MNLMFFWKQPELSFVKSAEINNEISVRNISNPNGINNHIEYINASKPVALLKSKLSLTQKKSLINLSGDHHGNDVLRSLSLKLIHCDFVNRILYSLPYHPKATDPIHQIYATGKIDIVLTDTDAGYGIAVDTTGRNIYETRKIAEIIRNDYL